MLAAPLLCLRAEGRWESVVICSVSGTVQLNRTTTAIATSLLSEESPTCDSASGKPLLNSVENVVAYCSCKERGTM